MDNIQDLIFIIIILY